MGMLHNHRIVFAVLVLLFVSALRAESIATQQLIDLDGQPLTLVDDDARTTAVLFLGTQCPISNRYIPALNDLSKSHQSDGVKLLAVISDPTITRADVRTYREQYKIEFSIV